MSVEQLREAIGNHILGDMTSEDDVIYSAATYACIVAANNCFGDTSEDSDKDVEVEHIVRWQTNKDNSYTARVEPL